MPFDGDHSSQFIASDLAPVPRSAPYDDASFSTSTSSPPSSPSAAWPTGRRNRSPSAPSCARDVYNVAALHLASARKPSVTKAAARTARASISGPSAGSVHDHDHDHGDGDERAAGVVRRRGSTMELEMAAASGRRPSVVAVVLEGSGSDDDERAAETAQEVLTDDVDVDMTIDHDLSTSGVPHSPKPFTTPLQALPPQAPPTPFLQPDHRLPARPAAEPEAPRAFPLGQPTLRISFCSEEGEDAVPPCFYPGQTIPTTLLFELPRYTTLPHALNPSLTMSLVGVLRCRPTEADDDVAADGMVEKSLINVGVSLEEGLKLWAKDAGAAWNQLSDRKKRGRANPEVGLPGGKYTLPLTVQVPTHPRLPPSYSLPGSVFQIVYQLEVNLTLDRPVDPAHPSAAPERVHLVQTTRQFSLLPVTLPSVPPTLPSLKGLLEVPLATPSPKPEPLVGLGISAGAGWMGKLHQALEPIRHSLAGAAPDGTQSPSPPTGADQHPVASWSIVPSLPTSTFSPSSNVPLDIVLRAPSASPGSPLPEGQLLVKASIVRREHAFTSPTAPSTLEESRGLVSEEEIIASTGAFDLATLARGQTGGRVSLPRLNLPLGFGAASSGWTSGMTTSLTVSPDPSRPDSPSAPLHTHCSSRFYVALQIAHSPVPGAAADGARGFALDRPILIPSVLKSRSLLIPITVGSVGEPAGARHRRSWRELYLARDELTGDEAPRMVGGSAIDDERGWLVPPPSYDDALLEQEYVL